MSGRWRQAGLGLAMLLAGCTVPPGAEAPIAGHVDLPPEVARHNVETYLKARGFDVASTGLSVTATAGPGVVRPGDERCDIVIYRDPYGFSNGRAMETGKPGLQRVSILVRLQDDASGTALEAKASYTGSYANRFNGLTNEASCRSLGGLERAVLAAAAG